MIEERTYQEKEGYIKRKRDMLVEEGMYNGMVEKRRKYHSVNI